MKVKLLTPRVLGSGQTQEIGDVIEVSSHEGGKLIEAGQAIPAPAESKPEGPKPAHKR